jgi:hypothetical protein
MDIDMEIDIFMNMGITKGMGMTKGMDVTKDMDKEMDIHGNGKEHGHMNKVTNIGMCIFHDNGQFKKLELLNIQFVRSYLEKLSLCPSGPAVVLNS